MYRINPKEKPSYCGKRIRERTNTAMTDNHGDMHMVIQKEGGKDILKEK
jgi:hypothetical protein